MPTPSVFAQHRSVQDLPNELLLHIFKIIYVTSRLSADSNMDFILASSEAEGSESEIRSFYEMPYDTKWNDDEDRLSPSLFPFSQAAVCSRWRDVLAGCSVFWTRVVIVVGENDTQKTVADYFQWSQGNLLEIYVATRDSAQSDLREREQIDALMPLIAAQFHRCKIIDFDLVRRSSLPDVRRWFSGEASALEKLRLAYHVDDDDQSASIPPVRTEPDLHTPTPVLDNVILPGCTFFRSCTFRSDWPLHAPNLSHLALKRSRTISTTETISTSIMIDLVSALPNMCSLDMRNIPLIGHPPPPQSHIHFMSLYFEGLDSYSVEALISATLGEQSFSLIRCAPQTPVFVSCDFLTLVDIPGDRDLRRLLADFSHRTEDLKVKNCPSFNDEILAALADGGPSHNHFPSPLLMEISLSGCTNFSPESMQILISARELGAFHSPGWVERIEGLDVRNGPPLTEEMHDWFAARISHFNWTVA